MMKHFQICANLILFVDGKYTSSAKDIKAQVRIIDGKGYTLELQDVDYMHDMLLSRTAHKPFNLIHCCTWVTSEIPCLPDTESAFT